MVRRMADVLALTGLGPDLLEIAITESMIMQDLQDSVRKMKELSALGVGLALDDFGTGHSSLSNLKSFPLSRLKIDPSFVKGIPDDKGDVAILKAIISLAENLGIETIAEGVETADQLRHLSAAACRAIQG